jgi:hypothetical protein
LGLLAGLLVPACVTRAQGANAAVARGSPTAERLPIYVVDPTWPPTLPNDWTWGDIRGLFVDDRDHLWIIHMPSSLTEQEIGAAQKPPIADCCVPAPPVIELDANGKLVQAWGGPRDRLHLVQPGAWHLHRPPGLRVDGHQQRHARHEVHAGRPARDDHR